MLQSRQCNMQNENSSTFLNDVPNQAMYDRIVMVPGTNCQRVPLPRTADSAVSGHRQPIEHPNDIPLNRRIQQARQNPSLGNQNVAAAPVFHEMERLSIRTPSEHQFEEKDCILPANNGNSGMTAIQKSQQKVNEWHTTTYDNNEANGSVVSDLESFVIDEQFSEEYSNSTQTSDASLSMKNSGYVGEYDYSDEDGTGLQKSLSGIQSPPDVLDSVCSRQNSSGSQSSLDSSLSFHTVYPSDAYTPKIQRQIQADRTKQQQQQQQNPSAGRILSSEHPHSGMTRPQATTSSEAYNMGRSQSQPGPSGYQRQLTGQSGQSGVRQINQIADANSRQDVEQKPTSVFITYAEERNDGNFKKLVLQLTKTLLSNGIQVRLDMLESKLISMSVSSWLDDNIQKCDFVVICVSPSYKSEVQEQQLLSETPEPHSLHTRYIYNRLLSEYIQKGSRNYRFIPVLIGGATRNDLPSLCLDTTVYKWPEHFEAIIYRLFKREKYIQPRVGPPPKVTVETYQNQED